MGSDYNPTSQNSNAYKPNVYKHSESLALSGSHRTNAPLIGMKGEEEEGQIDTEVDRDVLKESRGKRIPMQSMTKEKVPLLTARHLAASA